MNSRNGWWRIGVVMTLLTLILIVAACQSGGDETPFPEEEEPETINGVSPRDVPVIVKEAYARKDGKTLDRFIVDEDKDSVDGFYDLNQGPHGERKNYQLDPSYRLTEYRANADLYYYRLEYPGKLKAVQVDYFKVIRTKDGWKTYHHYSKPSWEYETQDLEPRVVKGVHDQP